MPLVLLVLIALGLGACLEPSHGKNPPSRQADAFGLSTPVANKLRGYEAINKILKQRLFVEENDFELITYIETVAEHEILGSGSAFIKLLGAEEGSGLSFARQGRQPNTINMLLWYTLFSRFADDLIASCDPQNVAIGNLDGMSEDVTQHFCLVASEEAFNADAWREIWRAVIADDANDREESTWLDFVEQRSSEGAVGAELASQALVSMLMNPYFLIAH